MIIYFFEINIDLITQSIELSMFSKLENLNDPEYFCILKWNVPRLRKLLVRKLF